MRMRHLKTAGLMVGFALWLGGCASTGPAAQKEPVSLVDEAKLAEVESKARTPFYQAERQFKAGNYKNAVAGYSSIKRRFPGGMAHQLSSYRLGTIYYMQSQYPMASQEFQSFLAAFPKSDLAFDVTYNLAATQYQQGQYEKAFEFLRRLPADGIRAQGPRRAEVVYRLGAQAAMHLRNPTAAIQYQASHLQLPIEDSKRQAIEASVVSSLGQISSADDLNALLAQVSEPTTRARIADRLNALSGIQQTAATPGFTEGLAPLAGEDLSTGEALHSSATSGDRRRIGVVVPLSGASAQYGRRALDGIMLAAGVFRREGDSTVELFVEDSGSNPVQAADAVEKLVQEHGVIAIIGPISNKESVAAGDKAQELGVLNLSLTGKEGISGRGAYVFQNALTPRVQMENLVKHAVQDKQLKRFAILAPDNTFGADMATEFAAVAERLGGKIVGYESYPPQAKDFQNQVRALAGLYESRFRKMENASLDKFMKEQQEKTHRASKARLPPIVDFDAVFLPDGPRAVAQIAAALAYFDVNGVTLLGTSEWNSPELYRRGGRLVEGAVFPGSLQLGSNSSKQREFVRLYADAYGVMPDLLAAQAYEAVELVAQAANASGGNRNSAVTALLGLSRFESPLGSVAFDQNRIGLRVLPILSLEPGGNIVEQ